MSAGKCPFSHAQAKSADSVLAVGHAETNGTATALTGDLNDITEAAAALNGCQLGYTASEPVTKKARCPVGHGQQQSNATGTDAEQDAAPAQCPMGFTAADGPRMTQFHCVICKSLLYDCVQLSCSCKYCRYCVANFQDCPLCGADITNRTASPELQGAALYVQYTTLLV